MNLKRGYLLFLVAIFAYLSWLLVQPFVQYVLGAILLAYILYPLQSRLEPPTSPAIAAISLVVLAIAGFVVPFVVMVAVVAEDAARILQDVNLDSLELETIETRLEGYTGMEVDLASSLQEAGQQLGMALVGRSTEFFGQLTHLVVGIGLTVFLLYYLLKDGSDLLGFIRNTTPLPADVQDDLYAELDGVMAAVLLGHVLIAIIQGGIAGLGLFATGIPNAAFWTFIMIILSLIPLVGSFLIWGPAVGYLLVTAEPLLAIGLFAYSTVIVGLSDDYLRPVLVDRYAELNPAVIILGVLGGVYAFGVTGLFYGPVVLGALIATMHVVNDHYHRLETGVSER